MTDSNAPLPPRTAWAMVAILTIANASAFVDRFVLAFLVTPIKADLGLSDEQVGALLGLPFALFFAVAAIPIGWVADRRSRRLVVSLSVAAWSAFTMGCGLVRTYASLFAMRIGVAIGEAGLTPPALSMMGDAFPPARLATAMSVFSLGIFLGAGLANIVGGWVVSLVGGRAEWVLPVVGAVKPWQAIFVVVGLPGLVIATIAWFLPEPPRRAAAGDAGQGVTSVGASRVTLLAFLREHWFVLSAFSLAVSFFATVNNGIAGWLPTFFQRVHGWTPQQAGLVAGSFTATIGVAGAIFAGRWADRLRARGHGDADLIVFLVGSVAMGLTGVLFPLMPTGTGSAVVLAFVNFPAAFPFGITFAATALVTPPHLRAQVAALFLLITNLVGLALGPWVVGLLTDRVFHDERAIGHSLAWLAGAGHLLASGCMWAARRRFRAAIQLSWN
ncbi:MAG: MFS transporter [Gemmatimonadetes bacterium]|nr:MFS transporter [Gemmatimonadota bacterium]